MFKEHLGGNTQQGQFLAEFSNHLQLIFVAKIVFLRGRFFDTKKCQISVGKRIVLRGAKRGIEVYWGPLSNPSCDVCLAKAADLPLMLKLTMAQMTRMPIDHVDFWLRLSREGRACKPIF